MERFDLSLNRSLEELISSYFEAHGADVEQDDDYSEEDRSNYSALENYLQGMDAL